MSTNSFTPSFLLSYAAGTLTTWGIDNLITSRFKELRPAVLKLSGAAAAYIISASIDISLQKIPSTIVGVNLMSLAFAGTVFSAVKVFRDLAYHLREQNEDTRTVLKAIIVRTAITLSCATIILSAVVPLLEIPEYHFRAWDASACLVGLYTGIYAVKEIASGCFSYDGDERKKAIIRGLTLLGSSVSLFSFSYAIRNRWDDLQSN